jgi:uncharacterized membrane protein YbhN (UPF0104 family)
MTATLLAPQVVASPAGPEERVGGPSSPGSEPPATPSTAGRWRRGVVVAAAMAVVVVEIVGVGPTLSGAFAAVLTAQRGWLAVAVLAAAASMSLFARSRRRLLSAAGVRVPVRSAVAATYVANAVHVTLPGGVAFSTAYTFRWMRSWGASTPAATWTLASGGVVSSAALAALALLGSLLVGSSAGLVPLALAIALVVSVAVVVRRVSRHPRLALDLGRWVVRRVNMLRRRPPAMGVPAVEGLVRQLGAVRPTGRDWLVAGAYATANWAFDAACLAASAAALGIHGLSLSLVLLAYTAGMAASSLSLLPGGLGVVDAALVLTLAGGGIPAASAVAAVLLYRLISLVGVVAVGWIVAAVQGVQGVQGVRRAGRPVAPSAGGAYALTS